MPPKSKRKKVCPSCGTTLSEGDTACPECGKKFNRTGKKSGQDDGKSAKTGKRSCPSCGELVSKKLKKCPTCGASLISASLMAEPESHAKKPTGITEDVVERETTVADKVGEEPCPICGWHLTGDESSCPQCGIPVAEA